MTEQLGFDFGPAESEDPEPAAAPPAEPGEVESAAPPAEPEDPEPAAAPPAEPETESAAELPPGPDETELAATPSAGPEPAAASAPAAPGEPDRTEPIASTAEPDLSESVAWEPERGAPAPPQPLWPGEATAPPTPPPAPAPPSPVARPSVPVQTPPSGGRARRQPALVRALARASRQDPRGRKLILASTRGEGRELLRQVAAAEGSWIGFEVTTVLPLAVSLAAPGLAADGLGLLDQFEQQAMLDAAIDAVLVDAPPGPLSGLAEGVGFRDALRRSVLALREAGISVTQVRRASLENPEKRRVLARILERYGTELTRRRLADDAAIMERAATELENAADLGVTGVSQVLVLPGLTLRGLAGRVVRALRALGADPLEADPVVGLPAPDSLLWTGGEPIDARSYLDAPAELPPGWRAEFDLFAASGVSDELREVLRRVVEAGLAWDEVEIIATDAGVYGSALHVLCETLEIPVGFATGLPVERTRPGRVVAAWFRWIEGGFGADVIRTLLAAGDLVPPVRHGWIAPARLARRLRRLRIGWGRDRYLPRVDDAAAAAAEAGPGRYEQPDQTEKRRERTLDELRALHSILASTLRATPPVPDRLDSASAPVSPAELARGLREFLRRVPTRKNVVDDTALERLVTTLERIGATLDRKTSYRAAATILKGYLSFRVPSPRAEGKAPWSSAGGHLYLSDIAHGGRTGRRATFIVGLDANRFPGTGYQDPLLLDGERWTLGKGALSRSVDRLQEANFRFAALVAGLRGTVTLSYSGWDPAEARVVAPSVHMLLGYRLQTRSPKATFEDLHTALGAPAGAVPKGSGRLDGRDVWIGSLARDGRLLRGADVVRRAFSDLDAGLTARDRRLEPEPNVHNGLLRPRPEDLDPRRNQAVVLSASRLEGLGQCPRRYLFQSVLRVRVPDDPELDPDRWLDPLQRGALLHAVYERSLNTLRTAELSAADLEGVALEALEAEAARALDEVPSPSRAVREREMVELRRDAVAFSEMAGPWVEAWEALEYGFGFGTDEPVPLDIEGGTVHVRGAVDRIDRTDAGLVVIDYKTGKAGARYAPSTGAFNGGRRLQNYVYSQVVGGRFGDVVARMQYDFPTHAGQNQSVVYTPFELASGSALLGTMFNEVAAGHFFPTDEPFDCTFCDYKDLCGVRDDGGKTRSPLADWSADARNMRPELGGLKKVREWDGQ